MKKIRHQLLRLRLVLNKKAKARYAEREEKRILEEIALKAQRYHEREKEILELVREKAEAHTRHKTKIVVDSGDAKRIGDKVILMRPPTVVAVPCAPSRVMTDAIRVEETEMNDGFQDMLDERHASIEKSGRREHVSRTRPVPGLETLPVIENTKIAHADALHFMTTGKIPVRTRAELQEIVNLGVEKVELTGNDAAALLYFSKLTTRK